MPCSASLRSLISALQPEIGRFGNVGEFMLPQRSEDQGLVHGHQACPEPLFSAARMDLGFIP